MPMIYITESLHNYLIDHLVNDSIDLTIRALINSDGLQSNHLGLDHGKVDDTTTAADVNTDFQDDRSVGGMEDSTNSGYIR